ncbi:MAG: hypothetical protein K6C95_08125 [Lachnospiraceae bacterium]|nr:hypothetical protein [Lachnospiraceae bacterium]
MPNTKMVARDFQMFAGELCTLYSPLFGTPAAEIARRMNERLWDSLTYTVDGDVEVESASVEELEDGRYKVSLMNKAPIPEEVIRASGLDEDVNEAVDELEKGIRDGLYPDGSYQRVMVDHMLAGLKAIQRRDLIYDVLTNPNADEIPGATVDRKTANYTFIPNLLKKATDENGNEIEVFPEGFAEDDPEHAFVPRDDIKTSGKHTPEEFQVAAENINYAGLGRSAESYTTSVMEALDLATLKKPRDAEQEQIIRQSILTNIDYVRQQINKARHADPTDPKNRVIFNDQLKKLDDTIYSDLRGLGGDLEKLDRFEKYLRSGLPVAGYREYKNMWDTAFNLKGLITRLDEETTGLENFVQAARDLDTRLEQLPQENSTAEQRKVWQDGVRDAMERYQKELKKIDPAKIRFNENVSEDIQKIRKDWFKKGETLDNESRNIQTHLKNIEDLGANNIAQRREYVRGMMISMADGMSSISRELKEQVKGIRTDDKDFRDAVDKVIMAGDPANNVSPQRFAQAMSRLQVCATTENETKLANWVSKQRAWFDNRLKEAETKGVMPDEPLYLQVRVDERNQRERLDNAFAMFNTKRSRIFGKDKETTEHKEAREAAEELIKARNELRAMRDNEGSEEWKKKAEEVMEKSQKASGLALFYMNEKKRKNEGRSPAGQERIAGAAFLYREAEITRAMIKKRIMANEKYAQMEQKTLAVQQKLDPDAPRIDPIAEQNARKAQELLKQEAAEYSAQQKAEKKAKNEKAFADAKNNIAEGAAHEERRVKEIDLDQMLRKFKLDAPKHEFRGRKPKAREDDDRKIHEKQDPQMQGAAPKK